MNKIKFRAWDGEKMFNVGVLDIDTNKAIEYVNWHDSYDGETAHYGKNEKGRLMQYTGLKDKNEKEIYEGDIVRVGDSKWFDKNYYETGIVEFKTPAWYFANIIPYSIIQSGSKVKDTPSTHYNTFEIIGNVYENENLLDKK